MAAEPSGDTASSIDSKDYLDDTSYHYLQATARALDRLHVYDRPIDLGELRQLLEQAIEYYRNLRQPSGGLRDEAYEVNLLRPMVRESVPSAFNRLMYNDIASIDDEKRTAEIHEASILLVELLNEMLRFYWDSSKGFSPMLTSHARLDLSGPLLALCDVCGDSPFNARNIHPKTSFVRIAAPLVAGQRSLDLLRHILVAQQGQALLHAALQNVSVRERSAREDEKPEESQQNSRESKSPSSVSPSRGGENVVPGRQARRIGTDDEGPTSREGATGGVGEMDHRTASLGAETILAAMAMNPGKFHGVLEHCIAQSDSVFILNVLNHWLAGFQVLCEALKHPDRCGLAGCATLLQPVAIVAPYVVLNRLLDLLPGVRAVFSYMRAGFDAAEGFAAFEDSSDPDTKDPHVLANKVFFSCFAYIKSLLAYTSFNNLTMDLVDAFLSLQQEVVLRLHDSESFTRQLAAVKDLLALIEQIHWLDEHASSQQEDTVAPRHAQKHARGESQRLASLDDRTTDEPESMATEELSRDRAEAGRRPQAEALVAWVKSNSIVGRFIGLNLHQSQYVDATQKLLCALLSFGDDIIYDDHLEYLWKVLCDSNTFEDIKANIYGLLGVVCPRLSTRQQTSLFARLDSECGEESSPQDRVYMVDMLTAMAEHDETGALVEPIVKAILKLLLQPGVGRNVATTDCLVRTCKAYRTSSYDWRTYVVKTFAEALDSKGGRSLEVATVAARHLCAFLNLFYQNTESQQTTLNLDLDPLETTCNGYEALLQAQATTGPLREASSEFVGLRLANAPDIGPFTHTEAVSIWHGLILSVIKIRRRDLSLSQLLKFLSWATDRAVTPIDATAAWKLLVNLAQDRWSLLTESMAREFFENHLTRLEPAVVDLQAWRCITAFMAALSKWQVGREEDTKSSFGTFNQFDTLPNLFQMIHLELVHPTDPYGIMKFLDHLALNAPCDTSASAGELLAYFLSRPLEFEDQEAILRQMQRLRYHIDGWKQKVIECTKQLMGRLPGHWHDIAPAPSARRTRTEAREGEDASSAHHETVLRTIRALYCLRITLRYCRLKTLPRVFAHAAAYKDFDAALHVHVPQKALLNDGSDAGQSQDPASRTVHMKISMPLNAYVGVLREIAAIGASDCLKSRIPSFALRLLATGRELLDDSELLLAYKPFPERILLARAGGSFLQSHSVRRSLIDLADPCPLMMTVPSTMANDAIDDGDVQTASQGRLFGALLAICQHFCKAFDAPVARSLASNALELLDLLPTCHDTERDVERLLVTSPAESRRALEELLCSRIDDQLHTSAPHGDTPNPIIMLYLLECLCAVVRPADNPLDSVVEIEDRQDKAALAVRHLLPNGLVQNLLHFATDFPHAGGPAIAPRIHWTLYLICSSLIDSLVEQYAAKDDPYPTSFGSAGSDDESSNSIILVAISRFVLVSLNAFCRNQQETACDTLSGWHDADMRDLASIPSFASVDSAETNKIDIYNPTLRSFAMEDVCKRGLSLLKDCIVRDHTARDFIFGCQIPRGGRGRSVDTDLIPKQYSDEASTSTTRALGPASEMSLGTLLHSLLSHPKKGVRQTTVKWIQDVIQKRADVRKWAFRNLIRRLVLQEDVNEEQGKLCNIFLSKIGGENQTEERQDAQELLDLLVHRLMESVTRLSTDDDVHDLSSTAKNVKVLIEQLDSYNMPSAPEIVRKMLSHVLFPDLEVLRKAHEIAIHKHYEDATDYILENYLLISNAARCCARGREACRALVTELMTRDRDCWNTGACIIRQGIEVGSIAFSRPYENTALLDLRHPQSLAGLHNGGATCYMNATLQQLFMLPIVRHLVLTAPTVPQSDQVDSIFHHVQTIFAHLAAGIEPAYEPSGFWSAFKDYEGRPVDIHEHQDAYEFFTRLQDAVDEYMKSVNASPAIHTALGGSFATVITAPEYSNLRSERDEEFYQISLDVRGKRGLLESLESYVAPELMNGPNQWLCEELGKKVDAEKRQLVRQLPQTLMFHLKRFEWDHETWTRLKVKDRFSFPMRLNMKPFTVEGMNQGCDHPDRNREGQRLDDEDSIYEYELCGIVVHSGTAFAGHYYSFIKDRNDGQWYRFDDTKVDPWDPLSVDEDCFGGSFVPAGESHEYDRPNSAYMLLYDSVRSSKIALSEPGKGNLIRDQGAAEITSSDSPSLRLFNHTRMNVDLCRDISLYNLNRIAMMHLLGIDLFAIVESVVSEARVAVECVDGRPRKSQKLLDSKSPSGRARWGKTVMSPAGVMSPRRGLAWLVTASPRARKDTRSSRGTNNHGGAVVPDTRHDPALAEGNNALDVVLSQAITLFMEYLCSIAARGTPDLADEIAPSGVKRSVYHDCVCIVSMRSTVASSIIDFAGGEPAKRFMIALECSIHKVYNTARLLLSKAIGARADAVGSEIVVSEISQLVDTLFNAFYTNVNRYSAAFSKWDQILRCLASIAEHEDLPEGCVAPVFEPYLPVVVEVGHTVIASSNQMTSHERERTHFQRNFLLIVSIIFRQRSTMRLANPGGFRSGASASDACDATTKDDDNPGLLRPDIMWRKDPLPLPDAAWDFLFQDPDLICQMLSPGFGVEGSPISDFLIWITYDNVTQQKTLTRAFLRYLIHYCCGDGVEAATDMPLLIDAASIEDVCVMERMRDMLFGIVSSEDAQERDSQIGLVEAASMVRPSLHMVVFIRAVLMLSEAQPEAWACAWDWAVNLQLTGGETSVGWATNALSRVQKLSHALLLDGRQLKNWEELINDIPTVFQDLYDLSELEKDLRRSIGADVDDDNGDEASEEEEEDEDEAAGGGEAEENARKVPSEAAIADEDWNLQQAVNLAECSESDSRDLRRDGGGMDTVLDAKKPELVSSMTDAGESRDGLMVSEDDGRGQKTPHDAPSTRQTRPASGLGRDTRHANNQRSEAPPRDDGASESVMPGAKDEEEDRYLLRGAHPRRADIVAEIGDVGAEGEDHVTEIKLDEIDENSDPTS